MTYVLNIYTDIPGGTRKHPELCVTIKVHILYGDKYHFAHL